jgi:hypothetical protein
MQNALQQLREQPRNPATAQNAADKIQDLADRAGMLRNNGPLSPAEIAQLASQLERARANIQRLLAQKSAAQSPGSPSSPPPGNTPGTSGDSPGDAGINGKATSSAFASEIINNIREDSLAAQPALPQAVQLAELRGEFHQSPFRDAPYADKLAFLEKIDPELENVIKLLRAENLDKQRPYPLTDDQLVQTPAGYRPAVADYFERLSRDYQTDTKATGK